MRHDDPRLIDALASEYVLGTLGGAARRHFERWRADSAFLDSRIRAWEERLMPLALGLPSLTPSPEVWQRIEQRIRADAGPRSRRPERVAVRALAAALLLCALLVGGYAVWQRTSAVRLTPIATIAGKQGPAVWRIEVDPSHEHLRAIALAGAAARAGHSFELWALPDGGAAPVSLGVLPDSGEIERTLTTRQRTALAAASHVAVSLEPTGGSPTGAPTGPVLFVADRAKNV